MFFVVANVSNDFRLSVTAYAKNIHRTPNGPFIVPRSEQNKIIRKSRLRQNRQDQRFTAAKPIANSVYGTGFDPVPASSA